ncbi:helix-turn-helix transcriptional regulator [Dactylosporangium sp. CA-052675]|uniref:helix-turn-helix transcriptional regulator n=1 Tax=Dactylosporangium sp. CA-052675 TaxID=3239927 RepID=UPI003D8F6E58
MNARVEVWSAERVRALGVATTLATAASMLGISRSQAYRLAADDAFPTPLIRAGARIIVPVAGLLRLLGLDSNGESSVDAITARPADSTQAPGDDA